MSEVRIAHAPLPTDLEAEGCCVGAAIMWPEGVPLVRGIVRPDHFSDPTFGIAWQGVLDLTERRVPLSVNALVERMPGVPGDAGSALRHWAELSIYANLEGYARRVRDLAVRRNLIEVGIGLAQDASENDDSMRLASQACDSIMRTGSDQGEEMTLAQVGERIIEDLKKERVMVPTGLRALDSVLSGGLMAGKLIAVQARMKGAKTTLLRTVSYNLLNRDPPVPHLFLSAESSAEQVAAGILARRMKRNSVVFLQDRIGTDEIVMAELREAVRWAQGRGLALRHRARVTLDDVRGAMLRGAYKGKIKGVLLDYLQLVGGRDRRTSMVDHLDHVAQTLAELCQQTGLWMMVNCQLNREGLGRGGDGMLAACDLALTINRIVIDGTDTDGFWLQGVAARYCRSVDAGTDVVPSIQLIGDYGPYLRDVGMPDDELKYPALL